MDPHYPYRDYLPFSSAMMHDDQFFSHDDHNGMMACVPIASSPQDINAVKGGAAYFPSLISWQYPPQPPVQDISYCNPPSPWDGSFRAISPSTDSQSSHGMSGSTGSYEDGISSASSFVSSPSPSYPDPPLPGTHHLEQQPVNTIMVQAGVHSPSTPNASALTFGCLYPSPPIEYASTQKLDSRLSKPSSRKTPVSKKEPKRSNNRVQKPVKLQKKLPVRSKSKPHSGPRTTGSKTTSRKHTGRVFECCFSRYGCQSIFPSKNEWKRHVGSQHIQSGFYRCDMGRCRLNNFKSRDRNQASETLLVNDFNRKDLFIQHQRRMHAPWTSSSRKDAVTDEERQQFESSLEAVWKRCWCQQRSLPTHSHCGFCSEEFKGQNAWKERMEHVARHFERADPGPEAEDIPLREWAIQEGIIVSVGGQWKLASLCRK